MPRRMRWAWGLLPVVVVLLGCQFKRVEDEKTISLNAKDVQPVMVIPGQAKDLQVTVTATTTPAAPITLYLAPADDANNLWTNWPRDVIRQKSSPSPARVKAPRSPERPPPTRIAQ